jgi:penicillin-insensitive murein endopeptidase
VTYLRNLALGARKAKLGVVVIGDLSQPRGGPTPTGHRSHQIGLDADVGYVAPAGLRPGRVSALDRERLAPPAVIDLATRQPTPLWSPKVLRLLELAVSDPAVDRIFVHPTIKRMLCEERGKAPWQPRIRPWWGHHDHFHVRLRCPPDSPHCIPQEVPPDDGCGPTLDWWFSSDADATRSRRKQAETVEPQPVLPEPCRPLLSP